MSARVLVADPPWKFGDSLPGRGRGAARHYPCLDVRDLMRFPLPSLADDAALLLWRVASMQQEALDVVRAWGFVVKSELVWIKQTKTGKRHIGMGRQVRGEHETCLIATRGRIAAKDKGIRSTFTAKVGEHSAKPDEFYAIVERLYDGPYVEFFARRERAGWMTFGNELAVAAPAR